MPAPLEEATLDLERGKRLLATVRAQRPTDVELAEAAASRAEEALTRVSDERRRLRERHAALALCEAQLLCVGREVAERERGRRAWVSFAAQVTRGGGRTVDGDGAWGDDDVTASPLELLEPSMCALQELTMVPRWMGKLRDMEALLAALEARTLRVVRLMQRAQLDDHVGAV